jgi:peptide chain release factor 2
LEDPDIWNDADRAREVSRERARVAEVVERYRVLRDEFVGHEELLGMAEDEGDEGVMSEVEEEMRGFVEKVGRERFEAMLSGEADRNDCFLTIHAGAGGTESQDWAEMLLRMYLRWGEARGMKSEVVEETSGEEAGLKSATVKLVGLNAYGWLKTENGVHRLVRISPFDSNARRHTSFCSVGVSPAVDDEIEVEFEEKDLRVDTYRASGAGGQHVNKTDSAVRITHLPTGIVVQSQNDRSQHKNRAQAYALLRGRLYDFELRKREEAQEEAYQEKTDIGWGHQIRSYVLHPYRQIKDVRTGYEESDTQGVLDGDLDNFLMRALVWHQTGGGKEG